MNVAMEGFRQLEMDNGTVPVKLFECNKSERTFDHAPSAFAGSAPVKALEDTSKSMTFFHDASDCGIVPEQLFDKILKPIRSVHCDNVSGIVPVKELLAAVKTFSLGQADP